MAQKLQRSHDGTRLAAHMATEARTPAVRPVLVYGSVAQGPGLQHGWLYRMQCAGKLVGLIMVV